MPTPPRQAYPLETLATLTFGAGGNSLPHQRHGFGDPEDGFTWSMGKSSELVLHVSPPLAGVACDHLLEMQLRPFVEPGLLDSQRLMVSANGVLVGDDRLTDLSTVGYRLPASALRQDGTLVVALHHPEATSPAALGTDADARTLGYSIKNLAVVRTPASTAATATALPPFHVPLPRDQMGAIVTAATGLDPRGLVLCFESLGRDCEFGMMQRHLGAEPLGLLRFAGIKLDDVLAGLRTGFAGVGDNLILTTCPVGDGRDEFIVQDAIYNIRLHTFRTTNEATQDEISAESTRHLHFMRRQLLAWLQNGKRLFVFQRSGHITQSEMRPLLTLLQSFGPNALLYVDQSPGLPPGAVEQLGHGFYHATLERMALASDLGNLDLAGWLSICVNAHRLWRDSRAT